LYRDEEEHNGHHVSDKWVFLVTDAESKLVPTFVVSPDRGMPAAEQLREDLASWLANSPRQIQLAMKLYF